MRSHLCYISRNYRGTSSAGNKAKTDNEDTLQAAGCRNLGLRRTYYGSKVATFFIDLAGVLKALWCLRRGEVLFLQYPVKKYFSFICKVARLKKAHTVALIHDLGSFRRQKLTVAGEIARLSNADYVIASNAVMKQWLTAHGLRRPVGSLGLFDYRSPAHNARHVPPLPVRLVYAGSLAMRKNAFLLELARLPLPYELHIYGNRSGLPGMEDNERMVFHDFMPADGFISEIEAHYGLVWDGDALDGCTGKFGEYLRYNSPHKASFYLRAGLPLIVWEEAAIAAIVREKGIGLVVRSLEELGDRLSTISAEQYNAMRTRAVEVAESLNSGEFLLRALAEAMEGLNIER